MYLILGVGSIDKGMLLHNYTPFEFTPGTTLHAEKLIIRNCEEGIFAAFSSTHGGAQLHVINWLVTQSAGSFSVIPFDFVASLLSIERQYNCKRINKAIQSCQMYQSRQ